MANEILLNNYSDDSNIKKYINNNLMPRVFHDIPLNILNTGMFSLINEYISQALENQSFTASFYFNESFITKAVLPDSIYAEASIFNIGYSYATPSSCYFLFEISIEDIRKNAVYNSNNDLYELIIDKDTKINLENGNVYSLDYDIMIQYKNKETSDVFNPNWNVQYLQNDELNSVATNKDIYITYRVTPTWLCLFIQANEYERNVYTVINNTTNGIAINDKVITCNNHIAGFDIKYINVDGVSTWIPHDHILPIHSDVKDNQPYVHYIMDDPQTIRFMFQLNGSKRFIPQVSSSYEITIYTCHGSSGNFSAWDNDKAQPNVLSHSSRYSYNANILKACFVLAGGSNGGTNIGNMETIRRETIEAYNTANVLSTDHDIDEWIKTFYFKNIVYPYFFKRRDDPWGRIWGGFLALKDDDDYIFRTNTLHARIPYNLLYKNNDNTVTSNEIIIPPGWIWVYDNNDRMVVHPVTKTATEIIETAKTLASVSNKFVFSNPFGIRIQKQPFAIGYFNPWINQYVTTTLVKTLSLNNTTDDTLVYHATPAYTEIKRLYGSDYYTLKTSVVPTIDTWLDDNPLISRVREQANPPIFSNSIWYYFNQPLDLFVKSIPMLPLTADEGFLPFNPETTYFCVENLDQLDDTNYWKLKNIWIDDYTSGENNRVFIHITGDIDGLIGSDEIWGKKGLCRDYTVYTTGVTDITIYPQSVLDKGLTFGRVQSNSYYRLSLTDNAVRGTISDIIISKATLSDEVGYGESRLYLLGERNSDITLNILFNDGYKESVVIKNASAVYTPYECELQVEEDGTSTYHIKGLPNISGGDIVVYAEMKPSPESGAVDYYRIPFSIINKNTPIFYINNHLLPTEENKLRVVLSAYISGNKSGYVEMQPVMKNVDGSYTFETTMYPLNQLVDIDNRITIASTSRGGGSWIPMNLNAGVSIEASNPEFIMSVLIKTTDSDYPSEIEGNTDFQGYRIIDEYKIDDFDLVQELKEMRSVVDFGESSVPTQEQVFLYNEMTALFDSDSSEDNIYTLYMYARRRLDGLATTKTYTEIKTISGICSLTLENIETKYHDTMLSDISPKIIAIRETMDIIKSDNSLDGDTLDWNNIYNVFSKYAEGVDESFESVNIKGGVTVQLVPMVQHTLMTSDRFESFVKSFTQVHKALEPIIFKRLEGNNYLDCKLTATYGLPHTYCADVDKDKENVFWPDLRVQIKFDVKLNNQAMATNTVNVLKSKVKSYFNKLTTVHTPADTISMDNNIYISQLIKELNSVDNVAYLKFVGFYTEDIGNSKGNFMDANIQAIVQKWDKLDNFPKEELSKFVPEMFILEDDDIVINVI